MMETVCKDSTAVLVSFSVRFLCSTAIITFTSAPAADAAHSDRKYSHRDRKYFQRQEVYAEIGLVFKLWEIP